VVIDSHLLPKKKSGFPQIVDGIVERVAYGKLESGINCVNDGHQEQTNNVQVETGFCPKCARDGKGNAPMKCSHNNWLILYLESILTTCPTLLLIFTSRSSSGQSIASDLFEKLQNTLSTEYP
jgi:hypothetical protein